MKPYVLALCLTLAATPALAQAIAPNDAKAHVGQTVTIEGAVSDVYTARSGTTFVNLGGRYPDSAFTAVIFAGDSGKFPIVHALNGKTVDITGLVSLYKGKPEIILKAADQLKAK